MAWQQRTPVITRKRRAKLVSSSSLFLKHEMESEKSPPILPGTTAGKTHRELQGTHCKARELHSDYEDLESNHSSAYHCPHKCHLYNEGTEL